MTGENAYEFAVAMMRAKNAGVKLSAHMGFMLSMLRHRAGLETRQGALLGMYENTGPNTPERLDLAIELFGARLLDSANRLTDLEEAAQNVVIDYCGLEAADPSSITKKQWDFKTAMLDPNNAELRHFTGIAQETFERCRSSTKFQRFTAATCSQIPGLHATFKFCRAVKAFAGEWMTVQSTYAD